MSDFTKEQALSILNSRKVIRKNGKYQVKVTSVHSFEDKYIVNVAAMNLYGANKAKELLTSEEYQEACNTNLSFNVFEGQESPLKGEFINIMVDDVKLKDGSTGKLIVGWSPIAVSEAETFSFDDVEESSDVDTTVEQTAGAQA